MICERQPSTPCANHQEPIRKPIFQRSGRVGVFKPLEILRENNDLRKAVIHTMPPREPKKTNWKTMIREALAGAPPETIENLRANNDSRWSGGCHLANLRKPIENNESGGPGRRTSRNHGKPIGTTMIRGRLAAATSRT